MKPIPKQIVMTWKDANLPKFVFENLKKLNPEFEILLFTDKEVIKFLANHYGTAYVDFFKALRFGKYKADFFRYCYLYQKGGFYLDVDLEPTRPIKDYFDEKTTFFSSLSLQKGHIFQAVLFMTAGNPIIKKSIDDMLRIGPLVGIDPPNIPPFHGHPTKCLYDNLANFLGKNPTTGFQQHKDQYIALAEEKKKVFGREAVYYKGKKLFYSRYRSYKTEKGFR